VTAARWLFGCALSAVCSAQNAQLSGLIQDPSALKVAGAEVTVRNEQTGGKRVTTSNRDGYYSVFSLRPGSYEFQFAPPALKPSSAMT
jgi:carboxypeptidase family protein